MTRQSSFIASYHVRCSTVFEKRAHMPMTKRMLKTADPTMVPIPTSEKEMNTPMTDVKSSGADPPAAMKVAPATSSEHPMTSMITSREGTKNSSQTMANATNMYIMPIM